MSRATALAVPGVRRAPRGREGERRRGRRVVPRVAPAVPRPRAASRGRSRRRRRGHLRAVPGLRARAALDARTDASQRVVMAVHYDGSQADEWVDKGTIANDGRIYRWIRKLEESTIPELDGIVFVSASARRSLMRCIPGADAVESAVVPNFTVSNGTDRVADCRARRPRHRRGARAPQEPGLSARCARGREPARPALHARRHRRRPDAQGVARRGAASSGSTIRCACTAGCRRRGPRCPATAAYVHAATREAFPYAVIEAMAAGPPDRHGPDRRHPRDGRRRSRGPVLASRRRRRGGADPHRSARRRAAARERRRCRARPFRLRVRRGRRRPEARATPRLGLDAADRLRPANASDAPP